MLYKINNIYLKVNKEMVRVGVVLVDRCSLHTEEITNSEYEEAGPSMHHQVPWGLAT